jgi:hypothetical protein
VAGRPLPLPCPGAGTTCQSLVSFAMSATRKVCSNFSYLMATDRAAASLPASPSWPLSQCTACPVSLVSQCPSVFSVPVSLCVPVS